MAYAFRILGVYKNPHVSLDFVTVYTSHDSVLFFMTATETQLLILLHEATHPPSYLKAETESISNTTHSV